MCRSWVLAIRVTFVVLLHGGAVAGVAMTQHHEVDRGTIWDDFFNRNHRRLSVIAEISSVIKENVCHKPVGPVEKGHLELAVIRLDFSQRSGF